MIKIFKTRQPRIFFILEDKISKIVVTKCRGHITQGVFLGVKVIERRKIKGINIIEYKEILESCYPTVFEQDVIREMRKRLTRGQ